MNQDLGWSNTRGHGAGAPQQPLCRAVAVVCRVAGFTTFCTRGTLSMRGFRRCMPFRRLRYVFEQIAHRQELDSPLLCVHGRTSPYRKCSSVRGTPKGSLSRLGAASGCPLARSASVKDGMRTPTGWLARCKGVRRHVRPMPHSCPGKLSSVHYQHNTFLCIPQKSPSCT